MTAITKSIMVTIQCLTYNHKPYIRQCLEGFVMQKTNFSFEAVIHDDASTDGTAEIIREYAEKFPEIIKPIYELENQYSKHDGALNRIMMEHTHGKYVAICEGDDYWTDFYKLQKQVDFLEAHRDYSMCFHNVVVLENGTNNTTLFDHLRDGLYDGKSVIRRWTVPTCSIMARRECIETLPWDKRFNVGDNVLVLNCASHGKLYCLNEKMGIYNKNSTGWVFTHENIERFYKSIYHQEALLEYFPQYHDAILEIKMRYIIRIIHYYFKTNICKSVPMIIIGLMSPIRFVKQFCWLCQHRS